MACSNTATARTPFGQTDISLMHYINDTWVN